jgi:D-amino-acid dehydrogenase
MRVAVIGAGIVGVTTAHALGADGHEVTVFERGGSVAAQASFAEGGLLAPGYFALREALQHPDRREAGLLQRWRGANASALARRAARQQAIVQLGRHSRQCLHELADALGVDAPTARGLLVLLRHDRERAAAEAALRSLEALGVEGALADRAACLRLEPGMADEAALAGGVHLPHDEVGNARQFAQAVRSAAQASGVRFAFHRQLQTIEPGAHPRLRHRAVQPPPPATASTYGFSRDADSAADETQPPPTDFDAVVVCVGNDAAELLAPLGLRLPLASLHGSSITAPLREPAIPGLGPCTAVVDSARGTSIARIGQRVRVAGALHSGRLQRDGAASAEPLYEVLHDWFPGTARLAQAQTWQGRCAASTDGLPLLGPSGLPGVWLNVGHGGAGWTWACGSARLVADQLAGRASPIDAARFAPQRFSA